MASVTITVSGTDPTVSIQTEDQTVLGGAPIELVAMSSLCRFVRVDRRSRGGNVQ